MSVITEIQEVINDYKSRGKSVDRITVNAELLNEATNGQNEVQDGTLLGFPCKVTNDQFMRYSIVSKSNESETSQ